MKAEYINPFVTASFSVLNALLGTVPTKNGVSAIPNSSTGNPVNVVCGVTGYLHGQIVIGMCQTTANRIASAMAGMPVKVFDSFAASAIAELGNMVCGNALLYLSESGLVCDITPPTIIRGANVEISTLEIPAIQIHLSTELGDVQVTVGLTESMAARRHQSTALAS